MIEANITIINKLGLHARAAAKLVATASAFASDIQLEKDGKSVDAKSIMSLLMLAAGKGTEIKIITNGKDESEACNAIVELINNRFDEEE